MKIRPSRSCFFIRTDLEKCSITSLAQLWMLSSEWVRQNESLLNADKTSQLIHTAPVHQLMSCEEKSCVLLETNTSLRRFFKMRVLIHNNASAVNKLSYLNQERNLPRSSTIYKPNLQVQMMIFFDVRDNRGWSFSLEKYNYRLWTVLYFSQKQHLKFKAP